MFLVSCFCCCCCFFLISHVTQHLQISSRTSDLKTRNIITTAAISTQTRCQIGTIHQRLTCSCNTSVHFVCAFVCVCAGPTIASPPLWHWQPVSPAQLQRRVSELIKLKTSHRNNAPYQFNPNSREGNKLWAQEAFFFFSSPIWGASKRGHIWRPRKS